ncbi:hypothetical protein AX769_01315 [Frondihabitans sp. PAMC 28766]|uniref:DUF3090 domain-containing protein n=1 Tax=Frondihabitans sp. PAMC 28766 TaxID=1795630 RepID=UPI00078EF041|nr:DUF3090 domain-containing protein [Frondihabitans sp. PAMC 28766]AMM19027.1 hypothetical protein AX769_01315 [Frondihabitans sp. PAMC 28766]
MPTIVHGFDWPDRLVVGTVGQPGSRSFYLQARDGRRVVSVALEKEQSALLAEKIEEILDELMTAEGNPVSVPSVTPLELVDNDPLEQPVEPQFRTGAMTLGWDPSTAQVVIEAYPYDDSDGGDDPFDSDDPFASDAAETETPEPAEMLQVRIPVGTARAFAARTLEIVGAGRPICPLCGRPIDGEGHICGLPDGE